MNALELKAPKENGTVILKRTFNQRWPDGTVTKFWRIVAPTTHRNYQSDLSIEGLKEWGVIQ
jgi:hypothetical protein